MKWSERSLKRFRVVPAVYGLLVKDDQVLLARRKDTGYEDGNYNFPSGHIDGEEAATEAMKRELREELGIEVTELKIVHIMHRLSTDREGVEFLIEVSAWNGTLTNTEPEKCDDLRWFPIDKIPDNLIPYQAFLLQKYKAGIPFSEYGFEEGGKR